MHACVRECMWASVRACVRVHVRECACPCVCMHVYMQAHLVSARAMGLPWARHLAPLRATELGLLSAMESGPRWVTVSVLASATMSVRWWGPRL